MSLTKIVSNVFKPRQKELERYLYDAEHLQHNVLMHLLEKGKNTEYGVKHLLNNTDSYEKFANNIPVNTYEELGHFNVVGSPFSIPKAALALAGFLPRFCPDRTAA